MERWTFHRMEWKNSSQISYELAWSEIHEDKKSLDDYGSAPALKNEYDTERCLKFRHKALTNFPQTWYELAWSETHGGKKSLDVHEIAPVAMSECGMVHCLKIRHKDWTLGVEVRELA